MDDAPPMISARTAMPHNIAAALSDNTPAAGRRHCMTPQRYVILSSGSAPKVPVGMDGKMSLRIVTLTCLSLLCAGQAQACYADYRAKMDHPLRLHYGVIDLPDTACSIADATPIITARLAASGWELLQIVSVFGSDGLAQRRSDAGSYFLRF